MEYLQYLSKNINSFGFDNNFKKCPNYSNSMPVNFAAQSCAVSFSFSFKRIIDEKGCIKCLAFPSALNIQVVFETWLG